MLSSKYLSILLISLLYILPLHAEQVSAADILYIGDSHSVGCFGTALDSKIRQIKNNNNVSPKVQSIAICGSSSTSWTQAPKHFTSCGFRSCNVLNICTDQAPDKTILFSHSLEQAKPKVTIIELGSNMLNNNWDITMNEVKKMIHQVHQYEGHCIWIGPPQAREKVISIQRYNEFIEKLKKTVTENDCHFIGSGNKTARAEIVEPMGLHYGCKQGTSWAQNVFSELQGPLKQDLNVQNSSNSLRTKTVQ